MTAPRLPVLSLLETRILGVLCEKQRTVPDTYPLSLNALVAGCNQKTSRHPIIEVSEAEVAAAAVGGAACRADVARPADCRRAAHQLRAPAQVRRHLGGGRLPAGTRRAPGRRAGGRTAAPA